MPVKSSVRSSVCARHVSVRSTPSVNIPGQGSPCPLDGPNVGESSNGRTTDSDSVCLGSNPSSPATSEKSPPDIRGRFFLPAENAKNPGKSCVFQWLPTGYVLVSRG